MSTSGPRAEYCVEALHTHVGRCQRAGYANGRADEREATQRVAEVLGEAMANLGHTADRLEQVCDERVPARDLIERDAARALIRVAREAIRAAATATGSDR